jgi:hypothetical protein
MRSALNPNKAGMFSQFRDTQTSLNYPTTLMCGFRRSRNGLQFRRFQHYQGVRCSHDLPAVWFRVDCGGPDGLPVRIRALLVEAQMSKLRILEAGELIIITSGEYSDYNIQFVGKTISSFDAEAMLEAWLTEHPDQRKDYNFNEYEFLAYLMASGLFQELHPVEWHLSDYSTVAKFALERIEFADSHGYRMRKHEDE